jgi:hypothetical protein
MNLGDVRYMHQLSIVSNAELSYNRVGLVVWYDQKVTFRKLCVTIPQ